VIVGSHLDSVPEGGWLDGCLGVFAGAQLLGEVAASPPTAATLAVVDWADEEGARFGHSLLGSSAVAGLLDVSEVAALRDTEGRALASVLAEHGVDLSGMHRARSRLEHAVAYLELHIEQGPTLEQQGRAMAPVSGALGIRRRRFEIQGQTAHAGAFPLELRRDASVVGAGILLAAREHGKRLGGRATVGEFSVHPGGPAIVPGRCSLVVDLRHEAADSLVELDEALLRSATTLASAEHCGFGEELLMTIEPVQFDRDLVRRAALIACGGEPLVSGALHDAVAIAQTGLPTAMLFVASKNGISHSRDEDTDDADLVAALSSFGTLAKALLAE
jgi:hydantoinase/carbamoylase family amidase